MTSITTRYRWPALLLLAACTPRGPGRAEPAGLPDPLVLGEFADDYGSEFTITPAEWFQHPRSRFHLERWRPDSQYMIARNDPGNPGGANLWTRIDWMPLPGMAPYVWGFCLSAYNAPTAATAESSHVARRETPRTGCNGHPFSRMKPRISPPEVRPGPGAGIGWNGPTISPGSYPSAHPLGGAP